MYQITGHTKLICLLGSPVAHSISPMMHNEGFQQLGLDYAYLAFDVKEEELESVVSALKQIGARGWNLTMPHKNQMCAFVDELSEAARIGGVVNTIVNENGKLIGHTTDGIGFMRAVEAEGQNIIGEKMTLLGAGGAAVSIMIQAALDGVSEISVFNRRSLFFERVERIIEKLREVSTCKISIYDYSDEAVLRKEIEESRILVNATSVGMAPDVEKSVITDTSMLHKDLFVYDAIYNPEETFLMKQAKAAGCKTANGLYMLLYQGAAAFELWTGEKMPVEVVKEKYFKR